MIVITPEYRDARVLGSLLPADVSGARLDRREEVAVRRSDEDDGSRTRLRDHRLRVMEVARRAVLADARSVARHPEESPRARVDRGDETVARSRDGDAARCRDHRATDERGTVALVVRRVERVEARDPGELATRRDAGEVEATLADRRDDQHVTCGRWRRDEREAVGRIALSLRGAEAPEELAVA